MVDVTPIIFIHYGPSSYLRHTLWAARRSNPRKEIFFIGDESNRVFCPEGVKFVRLESLRDTQKLREFRSVFQPIEGARHRFKKHGGTAHWLQFVFERWFMIEAFVRQEGIRKFWTFDSDTMIAADLTLRESRFSGFQATQQCRGDCLNGLVNDPDLVAGFTAHATSLFRDESFLNKQRSRLIANAGLCFNEMDAWQSFREAYKPSVCALGVPRNGEVFDDALGILDEWEPADRKVEGRIPVKKVVVDPRGAAFAFHGTARAPIRLLTLNLSWLPDYMFRRARRACAPLGSLDHVASGCRELDLRAPRASSFFAAVRKCLRG